jgi:hypothetical protein
MKKIFLFPLVALAAGCMAERPLERADARTESLLAEALHGRVSAGPPQSCVQQRTLGGNRSAGEGAIIFDSMGRDLVYVNRPAAGCPEIRSGRAIKVRTTSAQLCRGDIVEVFDPVSGIGFGGCGLGDFEPYRRVR